MVRGLYWLTFLIVTSLTYDVTVCLQCPTSADAWERASLALQCKLPNSYHCLKDEKNVITEQCLAKVWIEGGMCPVYSSRMSKIDVIECSTPSCPKSTYWSNSVFLFPVCFETKKETLPTTTLRSTIVEQALTAGYSTPFIYDPKNKTEGNKTYIGGPASMKDSGEGAERGNTTIYIVVGICAALLAGISGIILFVVCRRRKERKSHNHDGKVLNASTEKSSLMRKECSEESRQPHLEDTKGSGISGEGVKSAKCTCEVYVASGPNLPHKTEQRDAPQILLIVKTSPLEKKQIDEHAKKAFGNKYVFCWKMSHCQQHKQEEQASMLLKDFDFKTASVEEILKKLLTVVAAVEIRVAFVVVMALDTWTLNREDISQVEKSDGMLICKTVFVK